MKHIMIDLETLSTEANAVVTSIGYAVFNDEKILDVGEFHLSIQPQLTALNRHISASTILWWVGQEDVARKHFIAGQKSASNKIKPNLEGLSSFINSRGISGIWGNGANFDITILESLYKDCGMLIPWDYWKVKCYRTVANAYYDELPIDRKAKGVHHKAEDDAVAQAEHLIKLNRLAGGVYL